MKILAFAASNSRQSINKQLVEHAAGLLLDHDIEVLDLNDYEMPIYSIDREQEGGIPEAAQRFRAKIGEADALIISYAEHNGSYTVAFKNLYDWTSRIDAKVYQGKPMLMLATSPGPGGAANVLKTATTSAPYFGGDLRGSLTVPKFFDVYDADKGAFRDDAIEQQLSELLSALVA